MQEEVEQKTMALSVRATRLTAELLQKAFRHFLEAKKNKPQELKHGKQTLKELMKQNTNISSIEITHDNIKDFEGTAKKYGIDFALKKDISENPPNSFINIFPLNNQLNICKDTNNASAYHTYA